MVNGDAMKLSAFAIVLGFLTLVSFGCSETRVAQSTTLTPVLELAEQYPSPVLTVNSPGAEGITYGFEGGRVIRIGNTYHLITAEHLANGPASRFTRTNIGHWASEDRLHWNRVSTLLASTGDQSGTDPHAVLAGPMPVYNNQESQWELFYVGYRSQPESAPFPPATNTIDPDPYLFQVDPSERNPHSYYEYSGEIWRAVSKTKGGEGIGGPYEDVDVVMKLGSQSQQWEGLMGDDSFFPYYAGGHWLGFYGSSHTETIAPGGAQVGLASALQLHGVWTRIAQNPLRIEEPVSWAPKGFIENPIVNQMADGTYIAVYNNPISASSTGYTVSMDGFHWAAGKSVVIQPQGSGHWATAIRTPLGLISEDDGTFTLFYTGWSSNDPWSDPFTMSVGFVTLRLQYQ